MLILSRKVDKTPEDIDLKSTVQRAIKLKVELVLLHQVVITKIQRIRRKRSQAKMKLLRVVRKATNQVTTSRRRAIKGNVIFVNKKVTIKVTVNY
jgi:hypothetical protein